jgi:PPM family protein phosphatase
MKMEFSARTDRGRIRETNEDSLRYAPETDLFVLSDGMGGQASGEVASRLATETILAHCLEAEENPALPFIGERLGGVSELSNRLASAVRVANGVVHQASQQNPEQQGMGATVVAAWFKNDRLSLAHVGDSRVYRLRGEMLEQLTSDHSFVAEQVRRGLMTQEEAAQSQLQNVLMRALGVDPEVEPDVTEELVMDGDTILMCSDGLTRELSDSQIADVLGAEDDPEEAADRLIDLANQAGGGDNISVIVLRPAARPVGAIARIGQWFKESR